jgi:hypothetical protein
LFPSPEEVTIKCSQSTKVVLIFERGASVTLYSYCLRYDAGAAPNPFWRICTLVICKPAIRRAAKEGDWVVGLGSSASIIGDISGQVLYAMCVTRRMSMREYDDYCRQALPEKIPDWGSNDFRRRVGDCIYDFSCPEWPILRRGVHDERNRETDLGGKNALLSERFYYFGDHPQPLPPLLLPIVHRTQGHKSRANAEYAKSFVAWIDDLGRSPNQPDGEPFLKNEIVDDPACGTTCSVRDLEEDAGDEVC